jgi:CRP-like cAMP-binding protein
MDLKTQLAEIPLFEGISELELQAMAGCLDMHQKSFTRGEILYLTDQPISQVGVVLKGSIQMIAEDIEGNRTLIATLGSGELVGETFACGAQQNSKVTFQAGEDSTLVFMTFERYYTPVIRFAAFTNDS